MRRLLPLHEKACETQAIAIVDDEEKTTVRLTWERALDGTEGTLWVTPMRGYDKAWQRLVRFLRDEHSISRPAAPPQIAQAGPQPQGAVPHRARHARGHRR